MSDATLLSHNFLAQYSSEHYQYLLEKEEQQMIQSKKRLDDVCSEKYVKLREKMSKNNFRKSTKKNCGDGSTEERCSKNSLSGNSSSDESYRNTDGAGRSANSRDEVGSHGQERSMRRMRTRSLSKHESP